MRKYLFALTNVLAVSAAFAQTAEKSQVVETKISEYNRWSIELNAGQNKPIRPFAADYFSSDSPSKFGDYIAINHYDLGVRYMFNPNFGVKMDFAYDLMENQPAAGQTVGLSLPFETRQYRVGFQGIANLSRIMKFETFTSRFGLLAHAGLQVSQLAVQMGVNDGLAEDNGGFMIGLTPQFRITNRIVLTGDFTYLSNVRQHYNWDGSNSAKSNNLTGSLLNTSLGMTFYLGGNDVHADWYVTDSGSKEKIEDVERRLVAMEAGLTDSDQDGIADMFDAEPNGMAGVAVDQKGRTIDRNNNGVADELERYFDTKYGSDTTVSGYDVKSLINDGYVNVYFDFNSITPTAESASGINFLVQYLRLNPNATADVMGYADEVGNTDYNKTLSQQRAENVKQTLVAAGISASRMNILGNGEDTSVDKSSKDARQIVRRVTFRIK